METDSGSSRLGGRQVNGRPPARLTRGDQNILFAWSNKDIAELWKEAKKLIYETGHTIGEKKSDTCVVFSATGTTCGAEPHHKA